MVIRVRILMLSSLLWPNSCLMLPLVSLVLLLGVSLACLLEISTWSPPKSLAWQKGFRLGSGLIWRVLAGVRPAVTCKRTWESAGGHRRDFMVGCPLTVAAVSSCKVLDDRWIAPHLAVRTFFVGDFNVYPYL